MSRKGSQHFFFDPNDLGGQSGVNTGSLREFLDCELINRITNEEKYFGSNFLISKIDKRGNYRSKGSQKKFVLID